MKFQKYIDDFDSDLTLIAEKLLGKLKVYELYITSDISELSKILDPLMGRDNISNSNIVRTVLTLLSGTKNNSDRNDQPGNSTGKETSIIDKLFKENSLVDVGCRLQRRRDMHICQSDRKSNLRC